MAVTLIVTFHLRSSVTMITMTARVSLLTDRWLVVGVRIGSAILEAGIYRWYRTASANPTDSGRRGSRVGTEIERAKQRLGLSSDSPVMSCYEAGRDGFW